MALEDYPVEIYSKEYIHSSWMLVYAGTKGMVQYYNPDKTSAFPVDSMDHITVGPSDIKAGAFEFYDRDTEYEPVYWDDYRKAPYYMKRIY